MIKKEKALEKYIEMIEKSWTYEKLTKNERLKLHELFNSIQCEIALKGNFKHRWDILQLLYRAYLDGLGYCGADWRK